MRITKIFDTAIENIPDITKFIETELANMNIERKKIIKTMLVSEELCVKLAEDGQNPDKLHISIVKSFGTVRIHISCKCNEIENFVESEFSTVLDESDMPPGAEQAIRNIIISSQSDSIKVKYKNGVNRINLLVCESANSGIIKTLYAFGFAIIVGLFLRFFVPSQINTMLDTYVLSSFKTIFLDALKMIMCPLIFFSIAACIGTFSDLSELGKMGGKIMGFYIFTTFIAIIMSLCIIKGISPGTFGQFEYLATGETSTTEESVDFLQTLINIIPNNFITPFAEADTLQIIFLAILVGIATACLGKFSSKVSEFLSIANELIMKMASIITKFIPLMIFASITSMIITIDISTLSSIGLYALTILIADLLMIFIYCILVLILTKTSPIDFIKKTWSGWLNAFSLSSSNASMAYTMEVCDKKLNIQQKLYAFSIPLGATVNMDGLCIILATSLLFLAKTFGVNLTMTDMISLIFTIVMLTIGTPGIPGSATVCMSVLLTQFSVPMEAISIFIAVYSIFDSINTADNVMGDMVGTYVVAKRNGYVKQES